MHNWGFCEEDDVMKKLAMDMKINNSWEETKMSLCEFMVFAIIMLKYSTFGFPSDVDRFRM
jgi:hypothetical protein